MIPIPRCRLVLAQSDGRLRHALPDRTPVTRGDVVALVDTPRGPHRLVANADGRVGGALVGADHPVAAGEGVVWLDVA